MSTQRLRVNPSELIENGLQIFQQAVRLVVVLVKLLFANMVLVFVGCVVCSAVDRMFGLGTVDALIIFGVILAVVLLVWSVVNDKT